MRALLAVCVIVVLTAGSFAAAAINMEITGVVTDNGVPGAQVGEAMQVAGGTILGYSASPDLPQVSGDLDAYSWAMQGTVNAIVDHTIFYSGTGSIYYTSLGYELEQFTWSMQADYVDNWSTAVVTGTLTASAGYNFTWPIGPAAGTTVDWSGVGTGSLTGTFDSATNTLTATLVPEPMTLALLGLGGVLLRRRRV